MEPYSKHIIDEIDYCIKKQRHNDAFDFPIDYPEVEGNVKPILSAYDEKHGLIFILEIKANAIPPIYVSIMYGDGGVIIKRSKPTNNFEDLKFETSEGWINL